MNSITKRRTRPSTGVDIRIITLLFMGVHTFTLSENICELLFWTA